MSSQDIASDTYDRGIVPAETAARREREKENFKQIPEEQEGDESLNITGGFTVDSEGLANNYAIEPEMYINEPGDLREEEEAEKRLRQQELQEINETDETGKLTAEQDNRGRGTGKI
jgi:hypothetical protein